MSRDIDELNYLADLEDDDNFEPSDYNTQDMRNINEKVNRILYGKNDEQTKNKKSENKDSDQVDISKKATKSEHKEEKKPEHKEKKSEHKEKKENKKPEEKKETKPSNSNPTEELVDITKVKKDWKSAEHLIDYPIQYEYLVEIKSNPLNIPKKGSAIFLHCRNNNATHGCIAINRNDMEKLINNINENTKIKILCEQ